jgi:hypothetical protein
MYSLLVTLQMLLIKPIVPQIKNYPTMHNGEYLRIYAYSTVNDFCSTSFENYKLMTIK